MKKFFNWLFGGIEHKIFNLFLVTMLIVASLFTIVIFFQMEELNDIVRSANKRQQMAVTETALESTVEIVETNMVYTARLEAAMSDEVIRYMIKQLQMYTLDLILLHRFPLSFSDSTDASMWNPDKALDGVVIPQLIVAPDVDMSDPDVKSSANRLAKAFSSKLQSTVRNGYLNSAFVATADGIMIIADEYSASKYNDEGYLKNYDFRQRNWYKEAVNSGAEIFFSDVDADSFTGKLEVVVVLPVYDNGELVGVVGSDLFLDSLAENILIQADDGSFMFILNTDGTVILSPNGKGLLEAKPVGEAQDLRECEEEGLAHFVSNALDGAQGMFYVNVGDDVYYMAGSKIESTGWVLVTAIDKDLTEEPIISMTKALNTIAEEAEDDFDEGMTNARSTLIVVLIVVVTLGLMAVMLLAKKIVSPLTLITKKIKNIHGENFNFKMEQEFNTNDEVELLARAFADLSDRTRKYIREIKEITSDKERIGAELNIATRIQADMLPNVFPAYPDRKEFDLYASMVPAKEVGGDFYDFFMVDDRHIALVMADVSGKGVPAALFMVIAKTLIKTRTQMGGTPAEILFDVNNQLCVGNEVEFFVTVWLAIIDVTTGEGVAANAGHEHPALKHKKGEFEFHIYKHSPALAMMENLNFQEHAFKLRPGDVLFEYTDGVTEATRSDMQLFGMERLLKALNDGGDDPEHVIKTVAKGIDGFVKNAEQFDDITMLCFKYNGPSDEVIINDKIDVEADDEHLAAVQDFVGSFLDANGCNMKARMQIDIAVEEIFVNIAHYAYGDQKGHAHIEISYRPAKKEFAISFIDNGKPFNPLEREDPDVTLSAEKRKIGGLGIYMVKKSMDDVKYVRVNGQNQLTIVKKN